MAIRSNGIGNSTSGPVISGNTGSHSAPLLAGTVPSRGQQIEGTVTDVRGNQITIQMENGETFTGQIPDASQYTIGQKASFQVTDTNFHTVYLKALLDINLDGEEDTIAKALEEANLPKSPRNLVLVKSLLDNQQSISKQSITDALRLCAKYPNANVDSVITMQRLGLPMTEETVAQFENYQNQTHQLLYKMDTLTDTITEVMDHVATQTPEISKGIANEMITLALDEPELLVKEAPKEIDIEAPLPAQEAPPATEVIETPEKAAPFGRLLAEIQTTETEPAMILEKLMESLPPESPEAAETMQTILEPKERVQWALSLSEEGLPAELVDEVYQGEASPKELLTMIQKALPKLSDEQTAALIHSKPFQTLLKHQFTSSLTLAPQELGPENIQSLYQSLESKLTTLSTLSEDISSGKAFQALGSSAKDMQQNVDFMKLMNDTFSYVQLPISLKEQNAHGDLYVMTRKESLKKNNDSLKVLLHLDMENLGTLDIHISKERTHINADFYVVDDTVRRLLERNATLLTDALGEQGYSCSTKMERAQKEVDVVKDFLSQDAPVGSMKRYTFDLRA